MLFRFSKFALLILTFTTLSFAAERYVCETDPVYKEFLKGIRTDLNGAVIYDNLNMCENNCREYLQCVEENTTSYYCPLNKNIKYSSKNKCNSNCFVQNKCATLDDSHCKVIDIKYSDPVTDWTGKTVYTKREVIYECNSSYTTQIGCAEWKTQTINGDVDVPNTPIATSWKVFSGDKTAGALASLMEQTIHIFSGWKGECEHGLRWNNPFKDPWTLLSYAIMIYNAAAEGKFGNDIENKIKDINNKFDNVANDLKNKLDYYSSGAYKYMSYDDYLTSLGGDYATRQAEFLFDNGSSFMDNLKNFVNSDYFKYAKISVAALAAGFLTENDMEESNKFINSWMGNNYDADTAALEYAKCMASIGLSFPNMASMAFADTNNTSNELNMPYKNPIRLTTKQLRILATATSSKYVHTAYRQIKYNKELDLHTIIAITPEAYFQAGQVICGGKLAVANNANFEKVTNNDKNSFNTSAAAKAAIKEALSMLNPPLNIFASLAFDIISNIQKGDACHNDKVAAQWGLIQLKTNKFLNFNQCHFIKEECSWKLNLGFTKICLRHKDYYCCYDQILSRIFAEAIKAESGKGWNSCNDITINDFRKLSFRKCQPGENPYPYRCFPADKYDEFVKYLEKQGIGHIDIKKAAESIKNSIVIPGETGCGK